MTFSGTYDMKVYPKNKPGNDFFGFGVNFNYDRAGYSKLSLSQLQLGGSYTKELATNTFLTGGLQIGLAQRGFKTADLTFDNQFNGQMYDPTLPHNEDFSNTSIFFADVSVGGNLRVQNANQRTKLDVGVSMYHLNKPKQAFFDDSDAKLPNRFAVYGIGAIKLANPIDLLLHATAQFQSSFRENVLGAALRLYLSQKRGKELAFQFGVNVRLNSVTDAIVPTVEIHYQSLSVGVSYDVNVSNFEAATDNRGGPEIWVAYRILKVKPLSKFKTCPIF
jgi:type IX secretion system PorP/SprF family membrane protein